MIEPSDVRALTVKRPWSDLIAHHLKDVENRSWDTAYRGPLLIHSGRGWDKAAEAWVRERFTVIPFGYWSSPTRHPTGVVAVATLVDVCPGAPCGCGPWAMGGQRHWRLADVRALDVPVPAKGALGLWKPEPSLVEAVMAGVGRG